MMSQRSLHNSTGLCFFYIIKIEVVDMKYNITSWPGFKDHDINCTTLTPASTCENDKLSYTFLYNLSHTPIGVSFACSCCNTTTILDYTTAAGGFLALSTRVGLTEPRRKILSWKNYNVRRY